MKIFAFLSLFFLALPVTVNAQKELLTWLAGKARGDESLLA